MAAPEVLECGGPPASWGKPLPSQSSAEPLDPLLRGHKALCDQVPEINLDGIPAF